MIVRDALSLVLGERSEKRELEEHLAERVDIVRMIDEASLLGILDLIAPTAGEDGQTDVLKAALVLALAQPELAQRYGISSAVHGRRLEARLERQGDIEGACASLRLISRLQPGNQAIERALAALMRRQGMQAELVERYLKRAQALLDQGRHEEAIPWLREVLQIDGTRKDVARTIRDLRFEEAAAGKSRRRHTLLIATTLFLGLCAALVALREVHVRRTYQALPDAGSDLVSLRYRLEALDAFVERYPIWHGALSAMADRSRLRGEIAQINSRELTQRAEEAAERKRADALADGARSRAEHKARGGDLEAAVVLYREALSYASEEWPQRDRVERDIAAITALIEQKDP
jgi:tetratricopeptide (TPR) repeat protein